jgi:hypothetical protein
MLMGGVKICDDVRNAPILQCHESLCILNFTDPLTTLTELTWVTDPGAGCRFSAGMFCRSRGCEGVVFRVDVPFTGQPLRDDPLAELSPMMNTRQTDH